MPQEANRLAQVVAFTVSTRKSQTDRGPRWRKKESTCIERPLGASQDQSLHHPFVLRCISSDEETMPIKGVI